MYFDSESEQWIQCGDSNDLEEFEDPGEPLEHSEMCTHEMVESSDKSPIVEFSDHELVREFVPQDDHEVDDGTHL